MERTRRCSLKEGARKVHVNTSRDPKWESIPSRCWSAWFSLYPSLAVDTSLLVVHVHTRLTSSSWRLCLALCLEWWFSTRADLASSGSICLEAFSAVRTGGVAQLGATGSWLVEAQDANKRPAMHRAAPTTTIDWPQNVSSASLEKPWVIGAKCHRMGFLEAHWLMPKHFLLCLHQTVELNG